MSHRIDTPTLDSSSRKEMSTVNKTQTNAFLDWGIK